MVGSGSILSGLTLLPFHMRSPAPFELLLGQMNPESMEVEGAEEWAFFRAYWPNGMPPPQGFNPSPAQHSGSG